MCFGYGVSGGRVPVVVCEQTFRAQGLQWRTRESLAKYMKIGLNNSHYSDLSGQPPVFRAGSAVPLT